MIGELRHAATEGSRSRTHFTICPAVIAPEVRATSLPPWNRIMVGMPRMPSFADRACSLSD